MIGLSIVGVCTKKPCNSKAFFCPFTFFISTLPLQSKPKEAVTHLLLLTSYLLPKMEPQYKVNPLTGELQEYVFEYNGILALRNFTARVEDERLILHAADDVNFSILEALVSEVEINGVVYDNPTAAQEALTRLTFNQNRPVLLDKSLKDLILGAVQKVEGKGLSSNDFTNAYKQQLDTLEDYDIELDESTTELKFKKGNNVVRRIPLMFLDDEGTKLVYNRTSKTLELRDKRDNLLTSIPVSHFVSNIPTDIVVQNGKIKLMSGSEIIGENTISYNDLADKPELNYLPLNGGTVTGDINFNGDFLLFKDKTKVHVRDNGNIVFGNKPFNDLVIGEFKGIQLWGQGNDRVVLAGGGVTDINALKNENIKIGGRNYVLKSKEKQTIVGYDGRYWTLSEPVVVGKQYTFSCYATVETGRQFVFYFTDIAGQQRQYIAFELVNGYNEFTIIPKYAWTGLCAFHEVSGVSPAPTATIEKLKFEKGNKATDWTPAPEDLIVEKTWEKQQHSLYGESLVTTLPSVQREVVVDNGTSKNNLWTANNELNVGSRNVGGYAKINCNGYKVNGSDDNHLLLAGGGIIHRKDLIGKVIDVKTSTFDITPEVIGYTAHIYNNCSLNYNTMPLSSTFAIRKVFDGGEVKFTGSVEAIYTGDRVLNGKKGSTAIIDYSSNNSVVFIDIRNI